MNRFISSLAAFACVSVMGACATQSSAVLIKAEKAADIVGSCGAVAPSDVSAAFPDGGSIYGIALANGYVLTDAYAVPEDARYANVTVDDARGQYGTITIVARVVTVDRGAGFALLRAPYEFRCRAILADMGHVQAGNAVQWRLGEYSIMHDGQIVHPYFDFDGPGHDNDVMVLSDGLHDAGQGVYDDDGMLVGMMLGNDAGRDGELDDYVLALPADRIARFLDAERVPYLVVNGVLFK